MSEAKGRKSLLGGILDAVGVEVTPDEPSAAPPPVPASAAARPRAQAPAQQRPVAEPEVITSLLRTPVSAAAKPSVKSAAKAVPAGPVTPAHPSRVPALVAGIQAKIPTDNPFKTLADAEGKLEAAGIADADLRRTTALNILAPQGISQETLDAARSSLETLINEHFSVLERQAQAMLSTEVPQMRNQAAQRRQQIDGLTAQIETLTAEADEFESDATDKEADLNELVSEIDMARSAALSSFCG
ncbi:MAG: hypothetical protein V4682_01255 [Patescibacteria group bacterium]